MGGQRKWIEEHLLLNVPLENIARIPDLVRANYVVVFDNAGFDVFSIKPQKAECWTKQQLADKDYSDPRHDNYFMLHLIAKVNEEFEGLSLEWLDKLTLDKLTKLAVMRRREISRIY